jgi:hypothetical protein
MAQWTPPNPNVLPTKTNAEILNAIRNEAGSDYRSRIPVATDANMELLFNRITKINATRNEFFDALVNRIGLTWSKGVSFTNRLGKFKKASMQYGSTMEEIQVGLVKAKVYDPTREYLEKDIFGTEKPDVQSSFHTVNRKEYYKITVNSIELRKAFIEEGGLSSLIAQIMAAPNTSNEWDEYLHMARLFKRYDDRDGFFKVNVPDVKDKDSDAPEARALLRAIRSMIDELPFVSELYNAAHMPVAAEKAELELFVTPQVNAALDVNALAAAFNTEFTEVGLRTTIVRQQDMAIPGAQAILTTRDFFQVVDTVYESRSIQNPAGLTDNYFLHVQQIISASRFVPAVLFTTEDGTPVSADDPKITAIGAITIKDRTGATVPTTALPRGDFYQISAPVTVDPAEYDMPVSVEITSQTFSDNTFVRQNGTLFVGNDETATKIAFKISDLAEGSTITPVTKEYTLSGDIDTRPWPAQPTTAPPVVS